MRGEGDWVKGEGRRNRRMERGWGCMVGGCGCGASSHWQDVRTPAKQSKRSETATPAKDAEKVQEVKEVKEGKEVKKGKKGKEGKKGQAMPKSKES